MRGPDVPRGTGPRQLIAHCKGRDASNLLRGTRPATRGKLVPWSPGFHVEHRRCPPLEAQPHRGTEHGELCQVHVPPPAVAGSRGRPRSSTPRRPELRVCRRDGQAVVDYRRGPTAAIAAQGAAIATGCATDGCVQPGAGRQTCGPAPRVEPSGARPTDGEGPRSGPRPR